MRPTPLLVSALLASVALPAAARAQATAAPAAPDLAAPAPAAAPVPASGEFAGRPIDVSPPPAEVKAEAAKRKHGIFPLWSDAVRAKGFDLPNPYSVMFNYYYQSSDLTINNLQLQFNDRVWRNYDALIQIPKAKATGSALSVRPAIMILPFFSVYGVFSTGATQTDVSVNLATPNPVQFDTVAKSGVSVVAVGGTFQMGYKGVFGVADFNAAVSDVERLADTVGANMLSFRLGYSHKLNEKGSKVAGWVGTAGQVIDVKTEGTVRIGEVLPPVNLNCGVTDIACNRLQDAVNDPNATVSYKLDKKPKDVWNMLLGAQYALDRNWAFRVEGSFLGSRYSFFAGTAYEFDIY